MAASRIPDPATAAPMAPFPTVPLRWLLWFTTLLLLVLALLTGCASTTPPAGVQAVTGFDLQRYQGHWYEIARLDHPFERGMTDVSAFYTPQADGSVRVVNRGFHSEDQRWSEAEGEALFTGPSTSGSLKVSFFGPFYSGYHIAALDPDYRWALVVGSDTNYAWILARTPTLPPDTEDAIMQRAQALGVNTDAFIWVSHTRNDPAYAPYAPYIPHTR